MCGKGYYGVAKPSGRVIVFYIILYLAVLFCCGGYVIEFLIHSVDKSEENAMFTFWYGVVALGFLLGVDRLPWSAPFHVYNRQLNLVLVSSAAATAFCDYFKTELIDAWGTDSGVRDYAGVAVLTGGSIILVLILMWKTKYSVRKGL